MSLISSSDNLAVYSNVKDASNRELVRNSYLWDEEVGQHKRNKRADDEYEAEFPAPETVFRFCLVCFYSPA